MFHDVGLDEGKGGAGLVGEDVHGHVVARINGEESLEKGAGIAEKGLTGDIRGEAVEKRREIKVEVEFVDFSKQGEAGLLGAADLKSGFRGNEGETRGGEGNDLIGKVNFAGTGFDVDDVFVLISREMGGAARGVERDEGLREIRSHGGGEDDVANRVFPTGEGGWNVTVRSDEGVAMGECGASLAEDGHGLLWLLGAFSARRKDAIPLQPFAHGGPPRKSSSPFRSEGGTALCACLLSIRERRPH